MHDLNKKLNPLIKNRPDFLFFLLFLSTSMFSVRKVLFFYPINGDFNEYNGVYIYLSDIFLFLSLTSWIIILCNKYDILSIFNLNTIHSCLSIIKKCSTWNIFSKKSSFFLLKIDYQHFIHNLILFFPLILGIFSYISILWSENKIIALYRSSVLFLLIMLFYYIYHTSKTLLFKNSNGDINSYLNSNNRYFPSKKAKYELCKNTPLSLNAPSQFLDQEKYQQQENVPRGTFSEDLVTEGCETLNKTKNSLALFNKINQKNSKQLFYLFKVFNYKKLVLRVKSIIPKYNKKSFFLSLILLIQGVALSLSFSKSAFFGLFIAFIYLNIQKCSTWNIFGLKDRKGFFREKECQHQYIESGLSNKSKKNVPRGTFYLNQLGFYLGIASSYLKSFIFSFFKITSFKKTHLLVTSIILLSFFLFLKTETNVFSTKSLNERVFYLNVSRETFLLNPFLGIGAGQFVTNMSTIKNIESWRLQPVHNVFLLILNEYGVFIFLLFLIFVFCLLFGKNCSTRQKYPPSIFGLREISVTEKCSTWNIFRRFHDRRSWKNSCLMPNSEEQQFCQDHHEKNIIPYFKAILFSFSFIMFFDHYLWDIHQGQVIFWLIASFVASSIKE